MLLCEFKVCALDLYGCLELSIFEFYLILAGQITRDLFYRCNGVLQTKAIFNNAFLNKLKYDGSHTDLEIDAEFGHVRVADDHV